MKRTLFAWLLATTTGLLTAAQATTVRGDESVSPLYEDDAWYDVTEWFDGNDYNPTDELYFRWDNETYDPAQAAKSSDWDNDKLDYGFGADIDEDNQWFYDYDYTDYYAYDDSDIDGLYESSRQYYDYDDDGYYDAYASYHDTDGDGLYEDYTYISFTESGDESTQEADAKKQASDGAKGRNSKRYRLAGQVASTKMVDTRAGKRMLAHVTSNGQKYVVDLGPADQIDLQLDEGQLINVQGPVTTVGEKQVLLAKSLEAQGKSIQLNRSPRSISGTVVETMKAQPRRDQESQRMLIKLKTKDGKHALLDLGPADQLSLELQQGKQVEAFGVAAKLKDRPVLFVSNLTVDGKQTNVKRSDSSMDRQENQNTNK